MDRSARKMLGFIKTDNCSKEGYCSFSIFYERYCKYAGCKHQEAAVCLRYLEVNGCIRFVQDQHGRNVGIEIEHEGRHSLYFALKEK